MEHNMMIKPILSSIFLFFSMLFLGLPFGTAYDSNQEQVDIHGFISQGYLKTDKNNFLAETEDGTFEFNEMGINFSTNMMEKLRLGLQFFARDLGEEGNDDINIDWVFADYRYMDWFGFRVGIIKINMLFYNRSRDIDMLRTPIFLPHAIYHETAITGTQADTVHPIQSSVHFI